MNSCVNDILTREIGHTLFVPEDPQIAGALGCAHMLRKKDQ